jgi:hypothetical protein
VVIFLVAASADSEDKNKTARTKHMNLLCLIQTSFFLMVFLPSIKRKTCRISLLSKYKKSLLSSPKIKKGADGPYPGKSSGRASLKARTTFLARPESLTREAKALWAKDLKAGSRPDISRSSRLAVRLFISG